jgi:hypothetical protein
MEIDQCPRDPAVTEGVPMTVVQFVTRPVEELAARHMRDSKLSTNRFDLRVRQLGVEALLTRTERLKVYMTFLAQQQHVRHGQHRQMGPRTRIELLRFVNQELARSVCAPGQNVSEQSSASFASWM